MAEETTATASSKKSNLVKLVIGIVLAAAGYGGADAAGFELDPAALKFGLGGTLLLIAYIELRLMRFVPMFVELLELLRIVAHDKREAIDDAEPAPTPRRNTRPQIVALARAPSVHDGDDD